MAATSSAGLAGRSAAARWPVEVHVAPHRPVPDIPALDDAERDAFGPLYLDLLRRFDGTRNPTEVHDHIRATVATLRLEDEL